MVPFGKTTLLNISCQKNNNEKPNHCQILSYYLASESGRSVLQGDPKSCQLVNFFIVNTAKCNLFRGRRVPH